MNEATSDDILLLCEMLGMQRILENLKWQNKKFCKENHTRVGAFDEEVNQRINETHTLLLSLFSHYKMRPMDVCDVAEKIKVKATEMLKEAEK